MTIFILYKKIYSDIAVKRPPEVRVSKILAGQEADKTNLLLQALAEAINSGVDSADVVRKTLQNVGDNNENEEPTTRSRDQKDQERSERHRSSKSHEREREREREEQPPEKKTSSREASRVNSFRTFCQK